jgi:hypothetical protein
MLFHHFVPSSSRKQHHHHPNRVCFCGWYTFAYISRSFSFSSFWQRATLSSHVFLSRHQFPWRKNTDVLSLKERMFFYEIKCTSFIGNFLVDPSNSIESVNSHFDVLLSNRWLMGERNHEEMRNSHKTGLNLVKSEWVRCICMWSCLRRRSN